MREPVDSTDKLVIALVEQLKTSLVQIAQLAELRSDPTSISIIAAHSLRSVDAFLQGENQTELALVPVSVGAVLYDVAQELSGLASQCGVTLRIDEKTRTEPVMAHKQALHTFVTLLGSVLIQSPDQTDGDQSAKPEVILGCHRTKSGIVVGAFASHVSVSAADLAVTRALYGRASQASQQTGLQGAASIVLADRIATQLQTALKSCKHASLSGMGTLLTPSKQLRLWA